MDLSSLAREQTCSHCTGRWSFSHWMARKVPRGFLLPISFSGSLRHGVLYGLQLSLNVAASFPTVYHKFPAYSTAPLGMKFPKLCSKSVPLGWATELPVLTGCLSPAAHLWTTAQDPRQGQQLGESDIPADQAEVYNLWVVAAALHVLLTSPSMRGPVARERQWGPRIHALPCLQQNFTLGMEVGWRKGASGLYGSG